MKHKIVSLNCKGVRTPTNFTTTIVEKALEYGVGAVSITLCVLLFFGSALFMLEGLIVTFQIFLGVLSFTAGETDQMTSLQWYDYAVCIVAWCIVIEEKTGVFSSILFHDREPRAPKPKG